MTFHGNIDIEVINSAIKTGGEIYWRSVYQNYFPPIVAFISREYGPIPEDIAEELGYKTLLKLVNGGKKPYFEVERQFILWLLKAIRTTVFDFWKSREGRKFRCTTNCEFTNDMIVQIPEIEDTEVQENRSIEEILLQLSHTDQMILKMRANGTAYKIIAEELGIKENVARSYFHRAKRKFKKMYSEMNGKRNNGP